MNKKQNPKKQLFNVSIELPACSSREEMEKVGKLLRQIISEEKVRLPEIEFVMSTYTYSGKDRSYDTGFKAYSEDILRVVEDLKDKGYSAKYFRLG
ncbi:MAG: hypothetical protein WC511_05790 [Candidatus Pacearchaeota archaeon]|jgi:hypothetical protein